MKTFLLLAVVVFAIALTTSTPRATQAEGVVKKERAVMLFKEPVRLMGVTLKGEYLFVHNDEAMMRGEACTYIYQGPAEVPKNLVVSFHCLPAFRDRVATFTTRGVRTAAGQELTEYQFAGSTEAHVVPSGQHAEHVPLVTPN